MNSRALTVHSCQGLTMEKLALDLGSSRLPAAVAYVGLSRVTTLKGLFLLNFHANALRADERASREMQRLRAKAGLIISPHCSTS